jgi:hypothetical protein
MIAIARAEDVRLVSDGEGGWISVPDIKLPDGVEWSASQVPGQEAFFITFEYEGKSATTLWWGPRTISGQKLYIVDAPERVLQFLKDRLGANDVAKLVTVLRLQTAKGQAVRDFCKNNGWSLIRNSLGKPVGVRPPLVIAGSNPVDLDGEDIDEAEEILDLEG